MPKETCIYAVIDPTTDKVQYIGKTQNIKRRIREYKSGNGHGPVGRWWRHMLHQSKEPYFMILNRIPGKYNELTQFGEMYWVASFQAMGHQVRNYHFKSSARWLRSQSGKWETLNRLSRLLSGDEKQLFIALMLQHRTPSHLDPTRLPGSRA